MGGRTGSGDIMMLFDDFGVDSQDLYASFRSAGYDGPAAVINDDGFLPDDGVGEVGVAPFCLHEQIALFQPMC